MGASGWVYRVPFQTRVADALISLQERVLASGEYYWDEEDKGPRPSSRERLAEVKADEDFWSWGTRSILDMERVVPGSSFGDGTIYPLAAREIRERLGSDYPTPADFDAAYRAAVEASDHDPQSETTLGNSRRWSGRCTILYDGYRPCEFVFWGSSGN